jgi:hypothetical protein
MSNTQLSALYNMPIWIIRCDQRARSIVRVEGHTCDSEQIITLRDYMKLVICQS